MPSAQLLVTHAEPVAPRSTQRCVDAQNLVPLQSLSASHPHVAVRHTLLFVWPAQSVQVAVPHALLTLLPHCKQLPPLHR